MDFEQILIRLGLDAKAVTAGLTRVTSFVKGWATGLVHDLQHHVIGRLAGLVIFERLFEGFKEKALFVQRTAKETGLSTNMIQGMVNELGFVGEGFEGISKPLGKFNELIGKAKLGSIEARTKLMDLGIVTKAEEIDSLNLTKALAAAKIQFDKIGDASIRAARMEEMFGKSWERLMPVLELSKDRFDELDKSNFFTKLRPATLDAFQSITGNVKRGQGSIGTFLANILGAVSPVALASRLMEFKTLSSATISWFEKQKYLLLGIKSAEIEQLHAAQENLGTAQETTEAYLQQTKLKREQLDLENRIADRSKFTIDQLAEKGFRLKGRRFPEALRNIHAITPAIANAMNIKTLETAAKDATAMGDLQRASELQSRADLLATRNFALKSIDREPMKDVYDKLDDIHFTMERSGLLVKGIKTPNH